MRETAELIVHGPPGSAPPVLAAALIEALAEAGIDEPAFRLRPCGDDPGVDAMRLLAERSGDGAVLSTCTPVFLQAPLLRGMTLTHRGLTPIARLVSDHFYLVARADAPWRDAAGFVADLPRRPTRTGGYFKGGINHLLALAIAEGTKAQVEFVVTPSEPAVWDALIDGSIDWACGVAAELHPHLHAGSLRILAALGSRRMPPFAHVSTLVELGVPVTFTLWRGLIGPPALSQEQQARWHRIVQSAIRTAAWRSYLERNGQTDSFLAGAPFGYFLETEWLWYRAHFILAGLLPGSA